MSFRELSPEQLDRLKDPLIIDVRSPCEHTAESIPASTNIPLLSDTERAEVGTIYKNEGEAVARRKALRIISPKIPDIVDQILQLRRHGQSIVVHCWRGGLRSEAVSSFLSVVGIECWRLTGGYKAWRRHVLSDFEKSQYPFVPIVLHGLTGAGKTDVLKELDKLGSQVLDLEHLANHRGSVFGGMGVGEQPSQKNFDAALWNELKRFGTEPVFLEAESRKIGKISLPDFIVNKIAAGVKILVTGSVDTRSRRIVADYSRQADTSAAPSEEALSSLWALKERLGVKRVQEIEAIARSGDFHLAVRELLTDYYDPLYKRDIERARPFTLEVCAENPAQAAAEIASWLKKDELSLPAKGEIG